MKLSSRTSDNLGSEITRRFENITTVTSAEEFKAEALQAIAEFNKYVYLPRYYQLAGVKESGVYDLPPVIDKIVDIVANKTDLLQPPILDNILLGINQLRNIYDPVEFALERMHIKSIRRVAGHIRDWFHIEAEHKLLIHDFPFGNSSALIIYLPYLDFEGDSWDLYDEEWRDITNYAHALCKKKEGEVLRYGDHVDVPTPGEALIKESQEAIDKYHKKWTSSGTFLNMGRFP
ncbi:MAG TPA: hypothetical protein ENI23_01500 [bacterium]|nr:hypothetical protein [bacterium]